MKKYITIALLAFSTLGFAGAQVMVPQMTSNMTIAPVGDVEDMQLTCTDLQYTLKLRSKDATTNNEVTKLQEFLLDIGLLDTDPTGYFGAATMKAVKAFQKQSGLVNSGLVGAYTRQAIKERSCGGGVKPIIETIVPEKPFSEKNILTVYMNGSAINTSSANSKDDAYRKCKEIIAANISVAMVVTEPQVFKCIWNNQVIYTPSAQVLEGKPKANLGALVIYKNSEVIAKIDSMSKDDSYIKCKAYQASYTYSALKCMWNGDVIYTTSAEAIPEVYKPTIEAHGPGKNAMSCASPTLYGLEKGQVACYGIWDYGNEFGGDPDMCPQAGYGPERKTGCIVSTRACVSGKAVASKMVYPTSMDVNSSEIALYAKNLKSTSDAVKQQIPTLWEYTCTAPETTNTTSPLTCTVSSTSITLNKEGVSIYTKGGAAPYKWFNSSSLINPVIAMRESSENEFNFYPNENDGNPVAIYVKDSAGTVSYCPKINVNNLPSLDSPGSGGGLNFNSSYPQVLGASTMCVNLKRNFHRGDESEDTRLLQMFLISQEFMDGEVSGFYGDKTVEAVKRYQRIRGLPETGMMYDFTRSMINNDSCR